MEWAPVQEAAEYWDNPKNLDSIIYSKSVGGSGEIKVETPSGGSSRETFEEELPIGAEDDWEQEPPQDWPDAIDTTPIPFTTKLVPSTDLNKYPYQSVGKIYTFNSRATHRRNGSSCTAFYVGNDTIMTSAHVFNQHCNSAVFIPAQINILDKDGENYGHYYVHKRPLIHPTYIRNCIRLKFSRRRIKALKKELGKVQKLGSGLEITRKLAEIEDLEMNCKALHQTLDFYDIATAKLGDGKFQGRPSRLIGQVGHESFPSQQEVQTRSPEEVQSIRLRPIKVKYSPPPSDNAVQGLIIGYAEAPVQPRVERLMPHYENEGRMTKLDGYFHPERGLQSLKFLPAAWRGVSGGPWMELLDEMSESAAIGIQSRSSDYASFSPSFTKELFDKVKYQVDP